MALEARYICSRGRSNEAPSWSSSPSGWSRATRSTRWQPGASSRLRGRPRSAKALGLDRPWYAQYGSWAGGLLHGNVGHSLVSGNPIGRDLGQRLPQSIELDLLAIALGLVIALPIGVLA